MNKFNPRESGQGHSPASRDPGQPRKMSGLIIAFLLFDFVIVAGIAGYFILKSDTPHDTLVLYTTAEASHVEELVEAFTQQTGIQVEIQPIGIEDMVDRVKQERDTPRGHLLWSRDIYDAFELQDAGLLEAYRGSGWRGIPESLRDPDGHWAGFAARVRLVVINTGEMEATVEAVETSLADKHVGFGINFLWQDTTRVHMAVLWHRLGEADFKKWYREFWSRKLSGLNRNSSTAESTVAGGFDLAWSDSDDYLEVRRAGKPIGMVPVRVEGQTVVTPDVIAIIADTERNERERAAVRELADYLLSAEVEQRLAQTALQIPVGQVNLDDIPEDVRELKPLINDAYPLHRLGEVAGEVKAWLNIVPDSMNAGQRHESIEIDADE